MSALEAARLGDQIGHTNAMKGLLVGLAVGFVVTGVVLLAGAATIATGGLAAVVIGGALVAGTVTLVYSTRARELVARLTDAEGEQPGLVVSSLRTPIDADRTLEALVVRGAADVIAAFSGRLAGTKGVLSCDVTLAAVLDPRAERRPARPASAPVSSIGREEPR